MEFYIKQNSTLPILKMEIIKDGRSDFNLNSFLSGSSTFLISIYDKSNDEALLNINGILVNSPDFIKAQFVRSLRVEDENENVDNKRSQLKEFEYIFGLDLNNVEVKNKLLEYLNDLILLKL